MNTYLKSHSISILKTLKGAFQLQKKYSFQRPMHHIFKYSLY